MRTTALLLLLALTGCSSGAAQPRPTASRVVTTAEAERLAAMLFLNYDGGGASLTASFPLTGGEARLVGDVDWRRGAGSGQLTTRLADEPTTVTEEVTWAARRLASSRDGVRRVAALDPDNPVHSALGIVARLSSDRPENPQLLVNNEAQWLRSDRVGDAAVEVFLGPRGPGEQRLRYWVDGASRLRRLEIAAAPNGAPITVDFTRPGPRSVPIPADLAAPA